MNRDERGNNVHQPAEGLSPEKLVEMLSEHGVVVPVEEAADIHRFLKKLADLTVERFLSESTIGKAKDQ